MSYVTIACALLSCHNNIISLCSFNPSTLLYWCFMISFTRVQVQNKDTALATDLFSYYFLLNVEYFLIKNYR